MRSTIDARPEAPSASRGTRARTLQRFGTQPWRARPSRWRPASVLVALLVAVVTMFVLVGCDDGENPGDVGDDTRPGDTSQADTNQPPTDTGQVDLVDPDAVDGAFELGTNTAFESTPDSFVPMMDGAEVPLTFGVQGSWMVVLAFRTHDLLTGMLDVHGEITIDGTPSGELRLVQQETFAGGDGWDYYYNFFLAIDQADPPPQGTPATITMRVTDETDVAVERTHDVAIGPADGP